MGKSAKALLGIAGVIALLLCIRVAINIANKPDDPALIRQALSDAIQTSREGKPGGIMDLLSANLKVNGADMSANLPKIQDFVRKQHPDMEVTDIRPQIIGDEARIVSPVTVELGILGKRNLSNVTLIFRKEDATEYLILPTRKWKLTEVLVPDAEIADLVSGNLGP